MQSKRLLAVFLLVSACQMDPDAKSRSAREEIERYAIPAGPSVQRGPADAKVTIVEYSDFQCPFCARVQDTLARVLKEYDGQVRLVWKDNPLPMHQGAFSSAQAARAAGEQGRFWEMHDLLFANQGKLGREDLEAYAAQLKLDMAAFRGAMSGDRIARDVKADGAEAKQFGVVGTPTFFINGRPLR